MNNTGLLIRRLILAAISLAIGFVLTLGVVYGPLPLLDTTLQDYGFVYTFFTTLSLAIAIGIWLDLFMKTEILPS